ncbi:MAG: 16S rRNA (cytidine(1402)-2'-O)-methyltransferase [Acidimicrobiia bacterium]|nr:16S rRNA (cytidine(1402)-2'-O)-methyltransferase [Acidimicrobiia bacterium]
MTGTLVVCATPIGNLGDAPPRLAEALGSADVVYCEDTRHSRKLLDALGVDRPLRSYFVGNEAERSKEVKRRLEGGDTVALITDAGMPVVSDPGHSAVVAAIEAGATVTVVPGPSAALAALAVSGLPSERFVFEGFLPRKASERGDRLADLAAEPRTLIMYVSPSRLGRHLEELATAMGAERRMVVARELTKLHEEVWRGSLGDAVEVWGERPVKGEITVVIEGAPPPQVSLEDALARVGALVDSGTSLSKAVKTVAEETGTRKRRLYEAALALRKT